MPVSQQLCITLLVKVVCKALPNIIGAIVVHLCSQPHTTCVLFLDQHPALYCPTNTPTHPSLEAKHSPGLREKLCGTNINYCLHSMAMASMHMQCNLTPTQKMTSPIKVEGSNCKIIEAPLCQPLVEIWFQELFCEERVARLCPSVYQS